MTRLRALAAGLGVVLGLGVSVAGVPGSIPGPAVACAAEGPRAALVVDSGSRVLRLCVALDASSVSGVHLIELAADQHGLSYALGFGGQAVCQLDGVGPAGGDCFADYPDFWGYWHGSGDGGWLWASGGAASFRVDDGDVEGWAWGSGDTGTTHPAPPTTNADDVCPPAPPPDPSPSPEDDSRGDSNETRHEDAAPTAPDPLESPAAGETARGSERNGDRDRDDERQRDAGPSPTPSPPTNDEPEGEADLRAAGASVPGDGGPPGELIPAAALGLALAAAGWWRLRRTAGGGRT